MHGDARLPPRFWNKVECSEDGCWRWTASTTGGGYAQTYWHRRKRHAHCVAYEVLVGQVRAGLHLDHLCRVRHCVNPDHLEPVTCKENIRRGAARELLMLRHKDRTHCKWGHELTPENTLIKKWSRPDRLSSEVTTRACRICRYEQSKKDYAKALASGKRTRRGTALIASGA
jgi:hypothetical protein